MSESLLNSVPGPETSFQVVVEALRRRDDAAWQELLRRYSARLVGLARSRLFSSRLRAEVDPQDVADSVLRSLIRGFSKDRFRLESWDALWGLLMAMTVNRVRKLDRHHKAEKRALDLKVALHEGHDGGPAARLVDPQPTPLEEAALADTVQKWMDGLREDQRRVVELGLRGEDDDAIAAAVSRTKARVRQIRQDLREDLMSALGCGTPAGRA